MNKFKKVGLIMGLFASVTALTACGGGKEFTYKVTNERFDKSGMVYVTVEASGVKNEEQLKAFSNQFTSENLTYSSKSSLFIFVKDGVGTTNSLVKQAFNSKGEKQTGNYDEPTSYEFKK